LKKTNCYSLTLIPLLLVFVSKFDLPSIHQNAPHVPTGDTAAFKANQQAGWSLYSSYLNRDTPDSVEFEFIIQHTDNIDWNSEQFIGVIIKNDFKPVTSQQLRYQLLLDNLWAVRIEPNGQVFLR